ncbi:prepilin-type N-terminal cleavage/methylation domain-containing protein (plasmid) [Rhizobium sp. TH2]|uniref:type IV pilus modification PilV family protein n=1 Tax=Rhizobium sp. TH2 TaxID=2775403 RepID=UPI0021572F91|nr:prepilin-type N-terminal cleavage/methylation domain-containing protein [Rhizobium sp. TH2]UVC12609.1 prepilin-type N-terminal cleavage/methylation domain-containing protein [Rhizobium sp. TH2]
MNAKPSSAGRYNDRNGFTMIEVLVAFMVLAIGTFAVQQGIVSSASGTAKAEERVGAELVARSLLGAPLGTGPVALQPRSGTMNGYRWQLKFSNVELPFANLNIQDGKPPRWAPFRMVVRVSGPRGLDLTIETIRLVGG